MKKMKTKRKTKIEKALLRQLELSKIAKCEGEKRAYDVGYNDGLKAQANSARELRLQTATKFVSSVGQTMQQFAEMLHPDGTVSILLKH